MSEFTNNKKIRVDALIKLTTQMLTGKISKELVDDSQDLIDKIIPADIIEAFDKMVDNQIPMENLKPAINKIINLLFTSVNDYQAIPIPKNSFLDYLAQNNLEMETKLKSIRPYISEINSDPNNIEIRSILKEKFLEIEKFITYYQIKENTLFPMLEKEWTDYKCTHIMWSFHDDIRRHIKFLIHEISKEKIDLKKFHRAIGDLFFKMLAIKFREEKILFPVMLETISLDIINDMFAVVKDIEFPYVKADIKQHKTDKKLIVETEVNLSTGNLSAEQLILLFNHLPVDITFVDENNKVKYFSTPKTRIFPRTISIIGRDVSNCHPPESVHVVENIVNAFREGKKDSASFWIKMKSQFILIQYFALRNEKNEYKGVIEVSQEVSEIRALEGEQRLLDWDTL